MRSIGKPDFRAGEDENYCCAARIFDEERFGEGSEDYILPDYLPDVKKVVGVFPDAQLKSRFLGSGTLEYEGEVRYKILYVSEDNELKSVSFTTAFDDKIGSEQFGEECVEMITPDARNISVRMVNPRKFSVRSSNGACVRVYKRKSFLPELYGAKTLEDEEALVAEKNDLPGMNVLSLRENGLSISEDISFDAALPTADELIFTQAKPVAIECRLFEGEAQIRGAVQLKCLMKSVPDASGQSEFLAIERTLSFAQSVKNKALHEGGTPVAILQCERCDCRLREDEFGQKRMLELDMNYLCDLRVCYPKTVSVLCDAYSPKNETEINASLSDFVSLAAPVKGSFSVNETIELDLPENAGVTLENVFLTPELKASCEDGRAVLKGECAVTMLLRDGAGGYDVRRTVLPLRFRTDVPCTGKEVFGVICPRVEGARTRLDKNKLTLDFEVAFYGCVLQTNEEQVLNEIRILPEKRALPGKRGSILLYYPEKNESAFEIAKKYGASPESIEKQLSEHAKPLFIFRK